LFEPEPSSEPEPLPEPEPVAVTVTEGLILRTKGEKMYFDFEKLDVWTNFYESSRCKPL
jgi:hypothetical protein